MAATTRFEECGPDGGSGRVVNFACLNLRAAEVSAALSSEEKLVASSLKPELHPLFVQLKTAHARFRKARAAEDPNGTSGAVQSGMAMELDLDRAWLEELTAILARRNLVINTTASSFAAEDKQLNETYKQNLEDACKEDWCTTAEQYRAAARAWLAYRDAWVGFGTAYWAKSTPEQWRSWATHLRNVEQNQGTDQLLQELTAAAAR
ncbi:hypothetical protein ACFQBQ_15660 [Granulicella cerasi]|uniref:Lysozyme inhibitor LprI N-terminal domain-containing protein n=1 Tax=Granulicella cerasi TaxID=741063 RepID=A0ABW1ZCW4_9BACT|nr:hypothetical protein [Granulicella cerasi]